MWSGGYIVSGFPGYSYGGWGPYGSTPVVSGLTVFGPQAGGFGGGCRWLAGGRSRVARLVVDRVAVRAGTRGDRRWRPGRDWRAAPGDGAAAWQAAHDQRGEQSPGGQVHPTWRCTVPKQKYNSALERYRDAATTAPDLAESYFRQAFALLGSSQYESAKKALDRGLRVRPNWPDANFELATLYGPKGHLAKTSHRESLATAIEQNPQSADLHLLMGVMLFCDGERERSQLFFDQAIELGANAEHLYDRFIAPRPATSRPLMPIRPPNETPEKGLETCLRRAAEPRLE